MKTTRLGKNILFKTIDSGPLDPFELNNETSAGFSIKLINFTLDDRSEFKILPTLFTV